MDALQGSLARMPLLAVLRGITPEEAVPVGEVLLRHGIEILEVPLNSPEPYRSIRLLADRFGAAALVGAGTVLQPAEAARVAEAGGRIAVSPNFDPAVVAASRTAGLLSVPGIFTPSEAFAALKAGADALKLFPGDAVSPKVVGALRAVLPAGTRIVVTGGVGTENLADWLSGGADGAGIGSALYKPGKPVAEVEAYARRLSDAVTAWREAAS
ncbi:2-dehydro-3-deoxy-6-phosphogalactonate aldolase [Marinibaculum pumilum]|uniref:2-dehydro-3-deoxy-6-phosphogalactonate aldolase n=1 Tax=Marinibaculum pumilum TaxID=1766165 RepID=A0ABV7L893_9PROT